MMASLLAHRVTGNPSGPPVLLLNGGMMTMAAWERIAAPLEDSYRVVRCDLRGQLLSPGEPEPRLEAHVADVIALLDFLQIDRIHAAGTSYGGLVALKFAALRPGRAASVVAITTGELITPAFWEATTRVRDAALAAAAGGDGGRVLDLIFPATYSSAYLEANAAVLAAHRRQTSLLPAIWFLGLARILSSLQGLDLTPGLPRIQCPALIIAGERDEMFPLPHARALAENIPGARLEIVPGGSHGLVIEQPERVVEILRGFLASL
ncbi:MAG TPA: alpha/beta fold hydrolase [Thermoanaerobaculia bacterium]|jgi:3-oxoadipate enol-lactonase|nr:alpha/beta fold hydrolase [Thermoanaerobaculia bacterium]